MNRFVFALSAIALGIGTTSAFAASGCSGDFSRVDGRWIADPSCQRAVAQSIASSMHERIGRGRVRKRTVNFAAATVTTSVRMVIVRHTNTDVWARTYPDNQERPEIGALFT